MNDTATTAEDVRAALFEGYPETKCYALVDGARLEALLQTCDELGAERQCLFAGKLDPSVERTAPHLVRLGPDERFVDWLLEKGWGVNGAIFLRSPEPMKEVHKHLKRNTLVRLPGGSQVLFRFYDPRVFRAYLPTCTPEEVARLLGPCDEVVVEPAAGDEPPLHFSRPALEVDTSAPLRIREEQVDALRIETRSAYIGRVCDHLRQCFPDRYEARDPREVQELVEAAIEAAAEFEIRAEREVCRYAVLCFVLGPSFAEQRPGVLGILNDTSVDPPRRMNAVYAEIKAEMSSEGGGSHD